MVDPDPGFCVFWGGALEEWYHSRSGCFDNGKADNAAARSLTCGLARVSGTLTQRVVHSPPEVLEPRLLAAGRVV